MLPTPLPLPPTQACEWIELPGADLRLWPQALCQRRADLLLDRLRERVGWQSEDILIFGERRRVPRLVAWHGDPGTAYTYSGTPHEPAPWNDDLAELRDLAQALTGHTYNSVLLNLYRDGNDGMGWHADDEPELGREPAIASFSLGATRRFRLRHRRQKGIGISLDLPHGSLLLMAGGTQRHYVHAVPKTAGPVDARINLTFRRVSARG
jgi:alkylated DNA repair dioxygenase AlkB